MWTKLLLLYYEEHNLSSTVSADKFNYTCMGGDITIEGVNDKKDLEETRQTFSLLGKRLPQFDCKLPLL